MQKRLIEMGLSTIVIEGCGPFGISSGGYGYEAYALGSPEDKIAAEKIYERIEGREYGLYRYIADTIIEPESYYRALASKGVIDGFLIETLLDMPKEKLEIIAQANRDYMQVLDKMEKRHLIGNGDRWNGVLWTHQGSKAEVLFSFNSFNYFLGQIDSRVVVEDVTAGTKSMVMGNFSTLPMHTYIIHRVR